MTMTDPLGDMLTRIRNGLTAKKSLVEFKSIGSIFSLERLELDFLRIEGSSL